MNVAIKNLVRHWENVGKSMGKWTVKSLKYLFVSSNNSKKIMGLEQRNSAVDPLFWDLIVDTYRDSFR